MTTQHKIFKNISGGSRDDALPTYIHEKIPKSRGTVSLKLNNKILNFAQSCWSYGTLFVRQFCWCTVCVE